jgi:outer membrane protein assembly factor BamB
MRRLSVYIIIVSALLQGAALAADWPQFRGPSCDGVSPEKLTNKDWNRHPPKLLWKVPMNDDGYAGPSVAGGRVFIVDHKGGTDIVRAIDVRTGKDVWRCAYEDVRKPSYGFNRCSPSISQGRVYTYSVIGRANCFDAKTGKKVWSRDLWKEYASDRGREYSMSPLVDGNKVIYVVGGRSACVVALDKTTGKTIWQGGDDSFGFSTPNKATINGKTQYVVFAGKHLIGFDALTGKELWSVPWETQFNVNAAQPVVIGNGVFITSQSGCALVGVKDAGADFIWQNKVMRDMFAPPICYEGYIYGVNDPTNELVCLEPMKGEIKWKQPGFGNGSGVLIDGVILNFDSKSGDLVMMKPSPDRYEELGRFKPLGGESFNPPVVSNGKLIVRNKSTLACFSLQ